MTSSPADRPRLVCRCLGVSSLRILEAIRSQGLGSVAEVTKSVRAGGGCGTCHPEIEEILADAAGTPVEPAVRLENRLVCDAETRGRVEGSMESRIVPVLDQRGVRVTALEVSGLVVAVRLEGAADDEALRLIRDELRRLVCRDLEVVRSD